MSQLLSRCVAILVGCLPLFNKTRGRGKPLFLKKKRKMLGLNDDYVVLWYKFFSLISKIVVALKKIIKGLFPRQENNNQNIFVTIQVSISVDACTIVSFLT